MARRACYTGSASASAARPHPPARPPRPLPASVVQRPSPKRSDASASSVRPAQRLQHVRRLGRRAGGARRDRDVLAQAHQQRFAIHAREADVQVARQPHRRACRSRRDRRPDCCSPSSSRARNRDSRALSSAIDVRASDGRGAEPDDARDVQRARPHAALVTAAVEHAATIGTRGLRRRTYSAPTPFGPYSLCAVSDARSTPTRHVERHLADRLHRVACEAARPSFVRDLARSPPAAPARRSRCSPPSR